MLIHLLSKTLLLLSLSHGDGEASLANEATVERTSSYGPDGPYGRCSDCHEIWIDQPEHDTKWQFLAPHWLSEARSHRP